MATLTVVQLDADGEDPSFVAAAAGGDQFAAVPRVVLHVRNDDTVSHTATVVSQVTASPGIAPANVDVAVPAGEDRAVLVGGRFLSRFADATDFVQVTYDAVTSVIVAAYRT